MRDSPVRAAEARPAGLVAAAGCGAIAPGAGHCHVARAIGRGLLLMPGVKAEEKRGQQNPHGLPVIHCAANRHVTPAQPAEQAMAR